LGASRQQEAARNRDQSQNLYLLAFSLILTADQLFCKDDLILF
jgi:hypothetical protein